MYTLKQRTEAEEGEKNKTVSVDDKVVHLENPRELFINSVIEFNKVARHKIRNEKSKECSHASNNQLKNIMTATKQIKYLRMNLKNV